MTPAETEVAGRPGTPRLNLPPWRTHAAFAGLASAGLTGLWAVTRDRTPGPGDEGAGYWWPLWVALIWGLVVLLHYLYATGRLDPPVGRAPIGAPTDPRAASPQPVVADPPAASQPVLAGSVGGDSPGASQRVLAGSVVADSPAASQPVVAGSTGAGALAALTGREREILTLVAAGCANKEIARRLFISERTARTHVSNILRKLDLPSRTHAALLAVQAGLAGSPE